MTTIPATPKLIEGWYYHEQSQGRFVHCIRTAPEDSHVVTLCGQVWLTASTKGASVQQSVMSQCLRCREAEAKWKAK